MKTGPDTFGEASWHKAATKVVHTQYRNRACGTFEPESREILYRLLEDACQGNPVTIPDTAGGWSLDADECGDCATRMCHVTSRLIEAVTAVDAAEVIAYMESLWSGNVR